MFLRTHDHNKIHLQLKLQELARKMRTYPTPAEKRVWQLIRGRKICNAKFRCQHPFFNYILDFYSKEYKVIIEIDGPIHAHQLERDIIRDTLFKNAGYTILRFSNEHVLNDIYSVEATLRKTIISLPPSPK